MKRWYAIMVVVLLAVASLGCLDSAEDAGDIEETGGTTESVESATQTEIGGGEDSEQAVETTTQTETEDTESSTQAEETESEEEQEEEEEQISLYDRPEITTSQEAWDELMKGNKRYVAGESANKEIVSRREEVESGQHPFVTVITCSDSRVPPELLFDQGLGDIFVIRTAGNVVDSIALGSIEYGVEHLHTPLLIVLGHQHCGAVTAAVEGEAEGNIGSILEEIHPAVETAKGTEKEGEDLVEEAVDENVKLVIQNTLNQSTVVQGLFEEGNLKIVGAKYFLDSGKVELIEELSVETAEEESEG